MGGTEWACAWHCLRTSRCLYQGRALGSSSSPPCSCIYLVIMMMVVISSRTCLLAGGPCTAQQRPCQGYHRGFLGLGFVPMWSPSGLPCTYLCHLEDNLVPMWSPLGPPSPFLCHLDDNPAGQRLQCTTGHIESSTNIPFRGSRVPLFHICN